MGFKRHLPLFIIFVGAIFIVSQTVLVNHESSSYLQEDDKKHAVLSQNQQQPKQLDSAVQWKQEECRIKTSTTVPPTSEYKTNENESVPSASKEQIHATPNHHHDTSTLQNNKKNATKNPLMSFTLSLPVAKIACSSKNPTGQKCIDWDKSTKSIYGIIPSTMISWQKIYNIYDTWNVNIHLWQSWNPVSWKCQKPCGLIWIILWKMMWLQIMAMVEPRLSGQGYSGTWNIIDTIPSIPTMESLSKPTMTLSMSIAAWWDRMQNIFGSCRHILAFCICDQSRTVCSLSTSEWSYCWQPKMWWGNLLHKPSSEAVPTRDLFE